MYTLTQLIPLSKTLLEEENSMQSDMSNVKEALCFFKNLSLDSNNDVQGQWLSQMSCLAFANVK